MRRAAPWLAALVLVACRSPLPPGDTGVPLDSSDPRPRILLQHLDESARSRQSLRGTLRLSVDAPDVSFRGTQRFAAERPARLRIEILGLFNQIAAVLTTDGSSYQLFDAGSGQVEEGTVAPGLLWQVARVDLEPHTAVDLLLGGGDGRSPGSEPAISAAWLDEFGRIRIRQLEGGGLQRIERIFGPGGRLVEERRFAADGAALFTARFAGYEEVAGGEFATELKLEFHRTGAQASALFRGVELNPELAPELFVLKLPKRVSSRRGDQGR